MPAVNAVLHTPRLQIRPFARKDTDAIFAIYSDEDTNTFMPWFPVRTRAEAERVYEERYAASEKSAGFALAVCIGDRPVGYVHLDGEPPYDLGYALLPGFRGKGLAAEACAALFGRARDAGVPFVTATHDVNNPASGRVMQKLGMVYCYTYEEFWRPKNFPVCFRMYQLSLTGHVPVWRGYWEKAERRFVESLPQSPHESTCV